MTVKELIAKLQDLNPDLPVFVQDGMDPSDWRNICDVEHRKERSIGEYWTDPEGIYLEA